MENLDVSKLQPHQLRVVEELNELKTKRDKLITFLSSAMAASVDQAELRRLNRQLQIMNLYVSVLEDRIHAWGQ